jgi:hypothetical protein
MLDRKTWTLLLITMVATTCAHKAPPLFKDRLNPRLNKVAVINNRQIQLTFTEEIDTLFLVPDSVLIASVDETLEVQLMYPSLSASEVIIATEPMNDIRYEITGTVLDKAENRGTFATHFQGSTSPDTIAPFVTSYSEGENKEAFFLQFSEAMDTTGMSFTILPARHLLSRWGNYRYVEFVPTPEGESLNYDTTYYLFVRSARDLSGNPSAPFITSVTPDTVSSRIRLTGEAIVDTVKAETGLVLLYREYPLGISFIVDGGFSFNVRDSLPYNIIAVSGEYSGSGTAAAGDENIIILKKERLDIDSLID